MDRGQSNDAMLYLTDEQLLQGIELMFFAYKGFTSDPDRILEEYKYGRAHHRAIHFINRSHAITVNGLLTILGVTKQSLNRVLRQLIHDGMVESRVGTEDKRQRHLHLTNEGRLLEKELSKVQSDRVREAYKAAGPDAVQGFRKVLENMVDHDMKPSIETLGTERG
ncbi:MAG: MarR family transcriptional regulator [Pseudomonadota bacterium]